MLLGAYNWSKVSILNENTDETGFFCLKSFEYEPGCEDNIILNKTKEIIKSSNNGLFLFQEFIYGHGTDYEKTLKKTKTEYYNDYLFDLYSFMENENLLENTTIIFIADHGEKGYFDKDLWNYKTPLIIFNDKIGGRVVDSLETPLEFKDLLFSIIEKKEIPKTNSTFIIGQTKSSEIGYIQNDGKYFLGKLYDKELYIKESTNLSNRGITELTLNLLKYQTNSMNKSNEKNYWCQTCIQNEQKALVG